MPEIVGATLGLVFIWIAFKWAQSTKGPKKNDRNYALRSFHAKNSK